MITSVHTAFGATSSVYVMNKGEMIPRHKHSFAHTTSVAYGASEVEIYGPLPSVFQMGVTNTPVELPADIDHEIRALEDGTVVINISEGSSPYLTSVRGTAGKSGGVSHDDGVVIYADS